MAEMTYKQILDNCINGNISDAKKAFKRLDQLETVGFFTYLYRIGYEDPVMLINKLAK